MEPDTEDLLSEAEFREHLREFPPSAKLVAKALESDAPFSQGQLAEESLLPDRTTRYVLNCLEESDLVGSRYSFKDARKQVYFLNTQARGPTDSTTGHRPRGRTPANRATTPLERPNPPAGVVATMHATCTSVLVATATRAPTGATNAYLVVDDGDTLFVDPAAHTDRLDDLVAREGANHLAVTHTYTGHVGAVTAYARETGAMAWCRRGRERAFSAATGVDPDRMLAEGTTVPVGVGVEVLDTPGHARDHVNFVAGDDVLCSDPAVAEGGVVVGAPEGDVRAYLVALRRLHACGSERLRPGHGPEITDPRTTLARLVAHRNDREWAILDTVRVRNAMPDTVTDAAYNKDVFAVRDLARVTVVARIKKLAAER